MKAVDDYFFLQAEIYKYFGYTEDWVVIPLSDNRDDYWELDGEGPGEVRFHDDPTVLSDEDEDEDGGNYYQDTIYTQRFLPKWVYRGPEYTLICCDTQTDGNKFLRIFDNAKEIKPKAPAEEK